MNFLMEFTGAQTVREAEETARKIRDILPQASEVLIDCAGLEEVDLSFIQILIAAHKSAERQGKVLALAAPAQGVLLRMLDVAGITPTGPHRFWFEGGVSA